MQLTKIDRWLKECFIYETHIFTLRLPEKQDLKGVKVTPTDKTSKGSYQHKLTIKSRKRADQMIECLKENHLMYSAQIVEGRHWYNKFIAPSGKSFTYRWVLRFLGLFLLVWFVWGVFIIMQNADLIETLDETRDDFSESPEAEKKTFKRRTE